MNANQIQQQRVRRAGVTNNSNRTTAQFDFGEDGGDGSGGRHLKMLQLIRDAIEGRGRMLIHFRGFDRLIQPHRLWRQPDGSYLLEAFQLAGGSEWGDMGARGFRPSSLGGRLGGYEAWINFSVELIETGEISGGPFLPHRNYNPEPVRQYGEIDRQVPGRDDLHGQGRLF